jgi:gliding motility-associated-like protein
VSDSIICQGECVDFTDLSNGSPTSWLWTFAGANPNSSSEQNPTNICYDSAGVFPVQLIVSNANGSDTTSTNIFVSPLPTVNAGNDTTINGGQAITLNATGTGNSYSWTPSTGLSCTTCPNPTVKPDETTTYTVITSDSVGCVASDQITIYVDYEYVIYIPNIFSPNGDGKNDILYVRGKGIKTLYFAVYDRWGEKVFETTDLNHGWDGTYKGKELNKAVFVYYVKVTFIDNSEVEQKGDVTLIR